MDLKRRAYQEKAEAEMSIWNARIDELMAKAKIHRAEGKIAYYDQVDKLRAQRDSLADRLHEIKESTGDAWSELRQGFEESLRGLSVAFHSAIQRFGEDGDGGEPTPPLRKRDDAELSEVEHQASR